MSNIADKSLRLLSVLQIKEVGEAADDILKLKSFEGKHQCFWMTDFSLAM